MSGLKSAWELSLEKSDKLVPELKGKKKLNAQAKKAINDIRKEYKAKIADKDVTVQDRLKKLSHRTPPEEMESVAEELLRQFAEEKKVLEDEMESEIEAVRQRSD
jgi:polyhydroxyalkanoate synthesis regulator phasin